ncbi:4-hydroxy-tetrahydrodipicolinate reductase [Candidatus Bathyarchaeota archaeon]|nr:4-hydroxy-tetrahydrodipicolinate reductase [Candidatus Bathyarchaeota archaeon]
MKPIKICVAGADGKMGSTIIKEAAAIEEFKIVGAVTALESENAGKTLGEIGLTPKEVEILTPQNLEIALKNADVYISFTTPKAELENLPKVANLNKRIVMGTTGFTEEQKKILEKAVKSKVPAVFSPNFSIGLNVMLNSIKFYKTLPKDYDFSIFEMHHLGKIDAPSGTAKKIAEAIASFKGYSKTVYGREGLSKRSENELEVLSARGGGVPGIHEIFIAGQHELIRIEHIAFSRSVFARGALYAAKWLMNRKEPKIYDMNDVLGLER